jgi:hypothetical protein
MIANQMPSRNGDLEYVGAVIDITAAKNAEEALFQAQSQLARAEANFAGRVGRVDCAS